MNNNDFLEYVQNAKENLYFDRKSARIEPKDIIRHVVAFANANGGKLVIGVENDGRLTGFTNIQVHSVEEYKAEIMRSCRPVPKFKCEIIKYGNSDDEFILVINIAVSTNDVIYGPNEKVYLRINDASVELKHSQIMSLEYDKGDRRFEENIVEYSNIDDIDEDLLAEYKKIKNVRSDVSKRKILEARGLLRDGKLTNAGVLLFAKNPTKFLPNARIRFIRYDGKRAGYGRDINIIKEQTFDDPIPVAIRKVTDLVRSQLREFQTLNNDGRFEIVPEYPEFAWFEGIVNAVTHRDYRFIGDHIRVIMFDDRLEIFSPGKLPNIVTLENMTNTRFSRNPVIARFLSEFGWVKELNEGVNRIYSEMQKSFLNTPKYFEPNDNAVLLVLENNIATRQLRTDEKLVRLISENEWQNLNEYEKNLLRYMYTNNKVTVKLGTEVIKKGTNTTRNILKGLVQKNFVEWHGLSLNDPKQYYTLVSNE